MTGIFEAARKAISSSLIKSYFPDGDERGDEWWIISPLRSDDTTKNSFSINLDTGFYSDFADTSPDGKGDFIKLISLTQRCTLKEASEKIVKESGNYIDEPRPAKKEKELPDPIIIPEDKETERSFFKKVTEKFFLEKFGKAVKAYKYRDFDGNWLFTVCRFEKETDGKKTKNPILFYLGTDKKWYMKWHEKLKPFPMYGLEKLKKYPDLPFCVVEGEKCGDCEIPGYVVLSWLGGTKNIKNTDFSPLKGRKGIIWPDLDFQRDQNGVIFPKSKQPGLSAAKRIQKIIHGGEILDIYKDIEAGDKKSGWDVADLIEEGGDPVKYIEEHKPEEVGPDKNPLFYKDQFVNEIYGETGLRQFGGSYWSYNNTKHYWRKHLKSDLFCNLQTYLNESGLQQQLSEYSEPTTIINKIKGYLERHTVGYIEDNPFLEASMSPYVHFQNGAVCFKNREIIWHDRQDHNELFYQNLFPLSCQDYSIDFENYEKIDPEQDCPLFYKFCRDVIPEEYLRLSKDKNAEIEKSVEFFSQILSYSLIPTKNNQYFFALWGGEGTGKTFFTEILKSVVGENFCVDRRSSDVEGNRFAGAGLMGKKVFIEPDLQTRKPLDESFIKTYAGEITTTIEEKNEPTKDGVKMSLSIFMLSNYEFKTKGHEGLKRRMIMVPFKNNIIDKDRLMLSRMIGKEPHKNGETFDERPAIIALILKAFKKYQENEYTISTPEWSDAEKTRWAIESNPVRNFLEDTYFKDDKKENIKTTQLYDQYKTWCNDEGRKPLSKKPFYEEVLRHTDKVKKVRITGVEHFQFNGEVFADEVPF